MPRAGRWLAVALLALLPAVGCGASRSPVITTADDVQPATRTNGVEAEQLPRLLRGLGLTGAQRDELEQLEQQLERRLAPMADAGREYAFALAKVARQCDPDSQALEDAASWAVVVGEQVRGAVLDGIDGFHDLLTPAQRRAVAARLLDRDRERADEDDGGRTDEGARSLGAELDLSVGQLMSLLVRAQLLRGALEERVEPWRGRYRAAVRAFADDDFAIRSHDIAEVPAVQIATTFVGDAVRVLLPILEPEQCSALADVIERALREAEERRADERGEREEGAGAGE